MSGSDETTGDERLTRLLGGLDRAPLRQRLRRPFERAATPNAEPASFRLGGLEPDEVALLASLLARPARLHATSIEVDVATIDAALLRAGLAASLKDALELLDGPIICRSEVRAVASARWNGLVDACQDTRLAACLGTPGGLGLLKRLVRQDANAGDALCARAERVLAALPAAGTARAELAARILGDAHALDAGVPTATLVLAALRHGDRVAAIPDEEPDDGETSSENGSTGNAPSDRAKTNRPAADTERDRHVWARVGVLVNELARPALLLNLPLSGGGVWGGRAGEPSHITLRALVRAVPSFDVSGRTISICENPNVVALAADRLGEAAAPLVSTEGMPAAAQRTLLIALRAAGATLRYHGDFDWAGLRIAATVMSICDAAPWRFTADHYRAATDRFAGVPLVGNPALSPWDASLAELMQSHGLAIAEEATIDDLLADLAR